MVVLTALRSAMSGLARNPVLFVVTGVLALVQLPQLAAQTLGPIASNLVSLFLTAVFVLVVPFFQAGLLGMADEALDGSTRLDRFVDAGSAYYVQMLIAYLLLFAVLFVYWIAVGLGAVVFVVVALGTGGSLLANPVVVGLGVVLAAAALLFYLGFVFFVQFYGQAIVVDDLGAIDAYRRSVRLVRRNVVPTLGYFVLAGVFGVLFGAVVGVSSILLSPEAAEALSLPTLAPAAAVLVVGLVVVLTALFSAFFVTFSVAFYRGIASRHAPAGEPQGSD